MFYRISANDINAWAEKNTDGMIKVLFILVFKKLKTAKEIVRDLPRTTIAVLVNALWFSCLWLDPFDKNLTAEDGEFFGPTGKRKCAMMFRRAEEDMDCAALGDGSAVAAFLPLSDEYMSKVRLFCKT